jgi:hypothetical protein
MPQPILQNCPLYKPHKIELSKMVKVQKPFNYPKLGCLTFPTQNAQLVYNFSD